jgi:DNA-directed RNA polymerase subunit beta'
MLKYYAWEKRARQRSRVTWVAVEAESTGDGWIVLGRGGYLVVKEETGDPERFPLRPGDVLHAPDASTVDRGACVASLHGHREVVLALVPRGRVARAERIEFVPGVTVDERVDEITGLTRTIVRAALPNQAHAAFRLRPAEDDGGKEPFDVIATLPDESIVRIADGERVERGDWLATIDDPRYRRQADVDWRPTRDWFETQLRARSPRDGIARVDRTHDRIRVENTDGRTLRAASRRHAQLAVGDGERVFAGQALTSGERDHHALLRAMGPVAFAAHLADELEMLFALDGVRLAPTHIDLIVRTMLSRVRVLDPGDTALAWDEILARDEADVVNERVLAGGGRPARYETVLTGIDALAPQLFVVSPPRR